METGHLQPTPVYPKTVAPVALLFKSVAQRSLGVACAQASWFVSVRVHLAPSGLLHYACLILPEGPWISNMTALLESPVGATNCASPTVTTCHACSGYPRSRCEGQSLVSPVLSHPLSLYLPPCSQGTLILSHCQTKERVWMKNLIHCSSRLSTQVIPLPSMGPDRAGRFGRAGLVRPRLPGPNYGLGCLLLLKTLVASRPLRWHPSHRVIATALPIARAELSSTIKLRPKKPARVSPETPPEALKHQLSS